MCPRSSKNILVAKGYLKFSQCPRTPNQMEKMEALCTRFRMDDNASYTHNACFGLPRASQESHRSPHHYRPLGGLECTRCIDLVLLFGDMAFVIFIHVVRPNQGGSGFCGVRENSSILDENNHS